MPDDRPYNKPGDITPDMPDGDRLMMENPQCWPVPGEYGIGTLERRPDGSVGVDVNMRTEGIVSAQGKMLALRGQDATAVLLRGVEGQEKPYLVVEGTIFDADLHELVNGERTYEGLLDERPEGVFLYDTAEEVVAAGWVVD